MAWDWNKKLGTPAPAPPTPSPHAQNLPRGMGLDHGRTIEHYMDNRGQAAPTAPYQPPPPPEQEWQPNTNDPTKVGEVLPIWQWKGDQRKGAASEGLGPCPGCGGPRYVQGKTGGHMMRDGQTAYPAPTCFDCGYPNEQGVLAGAATASGPAMTARGQEAGAPMGTIGRLRK